MRQKLEFQDTGLLDDEDYLYGDNKYFSLVNQMFLEKDS